MKICKLNRSFFEKKSDELAKELIGKILIKEENGIKVGGKIVETEAYFTYNDKASHSFKRKMAKEFFENKKPGTSYVYLNYGMYYLFNIVSKNGAVLIRALEPLYGLNIMKKNKNSNDIKDLCSGPGKLTVAMNINKEHHDLDLTKNKIYLLNSKNNEKISKGKRIGISKDTNKLLRFYVKDNEFVSKK